MDGLGPNWSAFESKSDGRGLEWVLFQPKWTVVDKSGLSWMSGQSTSTQDRPLWTLLRYVEIEKWTVEKWTV